jgi:Putative peptidoglycan binding domain
VAVTAEAEEAWVVAVTAEAAAEMEPASAERASQIGLRTLGAEDPAPSFETRPSDRQPVSSGPVSRSVTSSVHAATTTAFVRQQNHFASPGNRPAQVSRSAVATPSAQRILSARNHIFERHDGNWHRDWDRRHAHYWNGHWWTYDGGTWIGLDGGYYPWDYSAYDYYDYYPGYYTDVGPTYSNDGVSATADQQADPNVSAVQSRLAKLGYYHGVIDGLFGPDTRSALTRYQVDNRLSVTASLTKDTLQSLGIQKIATS